jgi:hypothetical protein
MLLVLQLPLADLRPFSSSPRVVGPLWALPPDPQRRGFLRGIGALRTLHDVGAAPINEWPTDAWYVDARTALKLHGFCEANFARSTQAFGAPVHILGTLRRIACDGKALWQVQLGLRFGPAAPPSFAALRALIEDFLALPVQLDTAAGAQPLLMQRKALAARLGQASTPRNSPAAPLQQPLLTGMPAVYLETAKREPTGIADWMPVLAQRLDETLALLHGSWPHPRGDCAFVCVESEGAERSRLNNLRLNLLRLHAEREVLKLVLRKAPGLGTANSALEQMLARAHRLLTQPLRFGNDQQVLKAAFACYDDFTQSERDAISSLLADRTQSRQRAERLIEDLLMAGKPIAVNILQAGAHVSTVNVTGSNNTIGQINLETAFNQSTVIVQMAEPGPVKDALALLLDQTKRLAARLPEDQREEVVKNTETLAREAASKKPNAGILGISAKGLVEAAKAVAEMAQPIASAVGTVLGLLGLAL